nr:MAG TPA: hypothetical protein [Caudoviricetes sp.]
MCLKTTCLDVQHNATGALLSVSAFGWYHESFLTFWSQGDGFWCAGIWV